MSLRKPWRSLDRTTVGSAPDRYGLYEVGDDTGTSLGVGIGVLSDELRELLAYGRGTRFHRTIDAEEAGEPTQVRWEVATSKTHAEQLLSEHTE